MSQPEGHVKQGEEDLVCLLKKSLYGLKQSPRQWYKRFDLFITGIGFRRSSFDSCIYLKRIYKENCIYLILHVDDMLIARKDAEEIEKVKELLKFEFDMKELGPAKKILGMEISGDKKAGTLLLTQKGYLERILNKFGMRNAKPLSTPLAPHFKLSMSNSPKTEVEIDYMSKVTYSSVVRSLMHSMICTRPDIAQAVSVVSKFLSKPGKRH